MVGRANDIERLKQMASMLLAQCTDTLTQARSKNFEGYLKCEEGDLTCLIPAASLSAVAPSAPISATQAAQGDLGVDVNVTLSKKAARKLAAEKEGMVLLVEYYGKPKKSAEKHANETGQISLAPQDEKVEISGTGGHAHISGVAIDLKRLEWLAGPVMVNVNIASARKSGPDNILSCDFIDGSLEKVQKRAVTLHCALIEENYDTEMKPK